jgi:hypothetical protein
MIKNMEEKNVAKETGKRGGSVRRGETKREEEYTAHTIALVRLAVVW